MWSGVLPKAIGSILAFNLIAGLTFFGLHTVRHHLKKEDAVAVWAVTIGRQETTYTHVVDSNRTFWEETLLLLVFISANLVVGVGLIVLLMRYH